MRRNGSPLDSGANLRRPRWPSTYQEISFRAFYSRMIQRPRVAIIGVGLIGGSIGLALRQRQLAEEVVGVGRRAAGLEKARARGAVDRTTTNLVSGVAQADIVVVATPVDSIVDAVRSVAAAAPRATINDDGSTKDAICREFREPPPIDLTVPGEMSSTGLTTTRPPVI